MISPARWALFVVALTQLVLAAPALLLGEDAGATVHVARELGSFDVALAIGLLVAAWQPARAWGLLPVIAALGLVMAGTAVVDVARGTATGFGEAHHVLDLAGLVLLWLVAREEQAPAAPAGWLRHDVRWLRAALAALLGAFVLVGVLAAPAAAHASLVVDRPRRRRPARREPRRRCASPSASACRWASAGCGCSTPTATPYRTAPPAPTARWSRSTSSPTCPTAPTS